MNLWATASNEDEPKSSLCLRATVYIYAYNTEWTTNAMNSAY